jgi:predicted DNA-binding transcriptional regulator AlpA
MSATPDDERIAGDGWVTVAVLADALEIKQSTIRSWIRRGIAPPHYKLGSMVRFRAPEIRVWLDAHHIEPVHNGYQLTLDGDEVPLDEHGRPMRV